MSPKWQKPTGTEKESGVRTYVSGQEYPTQMRTKTDKAALDEKPFHLSEFKKPYEADSYEEMEHFFSWPQGHRVGFDVGVNEEYPRTKKEETKEKRAYYFIKYKTPEDIYVYLCLDAQKRKVKQVRDGSYPISYVGSFEWGPCEGLIYAFAARFTRYIQRSSTLTILTAAINVLYATIDDEDVFCITALCTYKWNQQDGILFLGNSNKLEGTTLFYMDGSSVCIVDKATGDVTRQEGSGTRTWYSPITKKDTSYNATGELY